MILEELRIRNWRRYRASRTFRFDPGVNLLLGPNEAGKSTVFEALGRALLDRHTSAAHELRQARPIGSSLGPEVQLVLRAQGRRYRVFKRFLHEPASQLWVEREGRFELDHEGDRADTELRRLIGGGGASRGVSRPEQRGLGQALWYLQRDDSLPARAWSQALHEGLSGLMKASLTSAEQDAVLKAIEREYESTFTRTGRVKKNSELHRLQAELPRILRELGDRRAELSRSERHRTELEKLTTAANELQESQGALSAEIDQIDRTLAGSDEVRAIHARALEAMREAERELARLAELLERTRRIADRTVEVSQQLQEVRTAENRLKTLARKQRRQAEAHARRWEEELEPRSRAVREQANDLRAKLRVEQLERELEAIEGRRARRTSLEKERAELLARLRELLAPSQTEWQEVERLEDRRRSLGERVRGAAVRVGVELEQEVALEVEPGAELDQKSDEYLVGRPTTFRIPGVATVRVRSVDRALERWDSEARSVASALADRMRRFGVDSVEAIGALSQQRLAIETRVEELRARLAEVEVINVGKSPLSEGELIAEIEGELVELRSRVPQAVLPGIEGWAQDRTLTQLRELERRIAELDRTIQEEREAEQRADTGYRQQHEEVLKLNQQSAALQSSLAALEDRLGEELAPFGDAKGLEGAVDASTTVRDLRRGELEAAVEQLREKVQRPQARRVEAERELQQLESKRRTVEMQRSDRQARLEEAATLDLHSQLDDLEGRHAVLERRLGVVERRAEATAIVHRLAHHHLDARARELVAPVTGLVDRWLVHLTGRRYLGLALDEKLVPQDIQLARYAEPLPLDSLSYGTYEQVVVLLRLALGVLLSGGERQLVILDDRLVNADPERLARFVEVLGEVGESCQLLIATCHDSPFSGIAARVLELGDEVELPAAEVEAAEKVAVRAVRPGGPAQESD